MSYDEQFEKLQKLTDQMVKVAKGFKSGFRHREEENAIMRDTLKMIAHGSTDDWAKSLAEEAMKPRSFVAMERFSVYDKAKKASQITT